jgi:hypothetical protein
MLPSAVNTTVDHSLDSPSLMTTDNGRGGPVSPPAVQRRD